MDVSTADPQLLLYLKCYRNTIPIPAHGSAERDYLQEKHGIEKPPFQLPSYIANTGIATQCDAIKEKEANMSLKAKTREHVQPKMGKIDIDYQKLHDAFFKFQTKPPLTSFGEMYYEDLSPELVEALSIPPLAPALSIPPLAPALSIPPLVPALSIPPLASALSIPLLAPVLSIPPPAPALSIPPLAPVLSIPPLVSALSIPPLALALSIPPLVLALSIPPLAPVLSIPLLAPVLSIPPPAPALSIPPLAPPPWLISMQRFGPPPSCPTLRIPGLNAPIPEGCVSMVTSIEHFLTYLTLTAPSLRSCNSLGHRIHRLDCRHRPRDA
jgi:hypothetical protein